MQNAASSKTTKKIELTENQLKVIKDKYLRDAASAEVWLEGVAHNIALAEILFHPEAENWGVYRGVHHTEHLSPAAGRM